MFRVLAAALAVLVLPAAASAQCALDHASRDIAVELERFEQPGIRPSIEDVARMMVPSPCLRGEGFGAVDLGLVAEDFRQGTDTLETARMSRDHSPAHDRITASGRRNSQ